MNNTKKPLPTDLPIHTFPTASDFEEFLEREHITNQKGIYVKLAKKNSGIPSIAPADAVEIALCFGWIDGRANSIDDQWWMVRYTPRRAKSMWSKKNVDTVTRFLLAAEEEEEEKTQQHKKETEHDINREDLHGSNGIAACYRKMRPAGIAAVEAAKKDGRWDRAYAGPATITVPEDFSLALAEEPTAQAFFDTFNRSERYSVLWRIETASPKARGGRIEVLVQMLAAGRKPSDTTTAGGGADAVKVKNVTKSDQVAKATKGPTKIVGKAAVLIDGGGAVRKSKLKAAATSTKASDLPRRAGLRSRS